MTGADLLASLSKTLGAKLQNKIEFRGETTFVIRPEDLREVPKFSGDELALDYLIDITSVNKFRDEPRFEIFYELYSMALGRHLRLMLSESEQEYEVRPVADICPTAQWHGRTIA